MVRDNEVWAAMHDGCPPEGCGSCVPLDFEADPEAMRQIRIAARLLNKPVDVFLMDAIDHQLATMGMR